MKKLSLLTVTALVALSSGAFAQSAQDAAYDKNDSHVIDSRGNCVRTKWMGAEDPCNAAAPAPAPVPVAAPAPAAVPEVSLEQRTVYFDFNRATLTGEAIAKLDQLAQIINDSSAIKDVRIHGFTDQFGSDAYNQKLAASRTASVKNYLDGKSRLASTIGDIKGIGKSAPEQGCDKIKARNDQIACRAKERRVEIEFKATR